MPERIIDLYQPGMLPEVLAAKVLCWCGFDAECSPVMVEPFAIM
jgi:hypothetical protein